MVPLSSHNGLSHLEAPALRSSREHPEDSSLKRAVLEPVSVTLFAEVQHHLLRNQWVVGLFGCKKFRPDRVWITTVSIRMRSVRALEVYESVAQPSQQHIVAPYRQLPRRRLTHSLRKHGCQFFVKTDESLNGRFPIGDKDLT